MNNEKATEQPQPLDNLFMAVGPAVLLLQGVWRLFGPFVKKISKDAALKTALILYHLIFYYYVAYYAWNYFSDSVVVKYPMGLYESGCESAALLRERVAQKLSEMDYHMMISFAVFLMQPFMVVYSWVYGRIFPAPPASVTATAVESLTSAVAEVVAVVQPYIIGERAMRGSDFIPYKRVNGPKFQAMLCSRTYHPDGSYTDEMLGHGFRVENALITASHVIDGVDRVVIVSPSDKKLEVDGSSFYVEAHDDLAVCRLTERQFSQLEMSKGTLSQVALDDGDLVYAQIYGFDSYSIGSVEHTKIFGRVSYNGSTSGGFSGAPYVSHNTILGMHQGKGKSVNLGLASAFLALRLSTKPEDSEDVLVNHMMAVAKRGQPIDYRLSPGDPEEVEFKWGRKYRVMDKDKFFEIVGFESTKPTVVPRVILARPKTRVKKPKVKPESIAVSSTIADKIVPPAVLPVYGDSKNCSAASALLRADAGASGKPKVIEQHAPPRRTFQPNQILGSQGSDSEWTETNSDSESPESMPVQQNKVLTCTYENTSLQPERKKPQQKKKYTKLSVKHQKRMRNGEHMLDLVK